MYDRPADVDPKSTYLAEQCAELGSGVPRSTALGRRMYWQAVYVATASADLARQAGPHAAATVAKDVKELCRNKISEGLAKEDERGRDGSEEEGATGHGLGEWGEAGELLWRAGGD